MNTYRVSLTRTYLVAIKAKNEYNAKRFSEFFLGDCMDLSSKKDRTENNFQIEDVEMVYNEALEIID
jgi:hypothetical protein